MGAALLAVGIELLIGIGIGLIVTVIGLFFGNIIVFDCDGDRAVFWKHHCF